MNRKDIVHQFNPTLDDKNLLLIEKLSQAELNSIKGKKLVLDLEKTIINGIASIKNRMEEVNIKINTSLFGNKKFINESFAFEVPLNEKYFLHPEKAQFKDNILTTKLSQDGTIKKIKLNASNITSRKNTDFKFIDNNLIIEKNEEHNYQELEIHIPKNINSGYLFLELNKFDNISILDKYGRELVDKNITKTISYIVTKDTGSLVIRFHTNKNKSFLIDNFYITQENFSLLTEIETKPIKIGYNLSQIGINTCDNYSNELSNISYYVSINGTEYKEIRPLNKQKNLHLNSIISVDTEESYYKLNTWSIVNGKSLFTTNNIEVPDMYIIRAFKYKLGVDEGLIRERSFFINLKKDEEIIIHKDDEITINDVYFKATTNNTILKLKKGFNSIIANKKLLNETENFLNKTEIEISKDYSTMSYKNIEDNLIYKKIINYNPNIKEKNSLIYQLITKGDIFLEPTEAKKVSVNNELYIEKEKVLDNLHIFIKQRLLKVETIKIKIKLESLSKNIPAYISNLTIRGTQ